MEQNNIYIFGAHSRAQTLATYLKALYPKTRIRGYLVDNDESNEQEIDGIPILHMDVHPELNTQFPVYIGTRGVYHDRIYALLTKMGMKHIIPVTPSLDMDLRNRFLKQYFNSHGRPFDKIESHPSVCIYTVESIMDKPLTEPYAASVYQKKLQVGAALADVQITELTDDIGENISDHNSQFCELTGLYWLWKHAKEDIIGMEHYRRHFLLPPDWVSRMESRKIDVILPTPLYVTPNIAENYKKRHEASDWDFMMEYLREHDWQDYMAAASFFETNLYSPCNMFIMKKNVLNELCTWLFPILFACAGHIGQKSDAYQNRYPGFLSERLMTFFFEKNREQYKMVYADKNFLS